MARTFTVAQLTARAKQRADMENDDSISTAEWQSLLSSAYGELYATIVKSGWRYYETEASLTTTSTALPAGFLKALSVDYVVNSTTDERRPLRHLDIQERNLYRGMGAQQSLGWCLEGANIVLYPSLVSGQTYKFKYIPQPTDLTSALTSDSVDVVTPDGENFVVWAAALMAYAKDDDDRRFFAKDERDRAKANVMEDAAERAFLDPHRVHTDDEDGGYLPGDYI
jgi:hypothetical protein